MRVLSCILVIAGVVLPCGAALADEALPVGSFEGTGVWRAIDGSSGEYRSRIVIKEDRITVEAEYEREGVPRKERHTMMLESRGSGFFELSDGKGQTIGSLACLQDQCFYSVEQDGLAVAESWRVSGVELQKFGSKEIGGFKIVWKETLFSN